MFKHVGAEILHLQNGLSEFHMRLGIGIFQAAADHHTDQILRGGRGGVHRSDVAAVTQNADSIRNLENLMHTMGYVHDGHPLLAQLLDDTKQALGILFRDRGGRLIHDDDLCICGDSFCDLYDLALCN